MATAATLINRALRLLGQIGSGEEGSTAELADGLVALNAMAEAWRNEALLTYAKQEQSLTLADGDASYTVGPSGDLNTDRPVAIEAAWIVVDDVSYPVRIIQEDEYAAIPDKTEESDWPDRLLYRPTMATGTVIVYPVPNATRTLKLLTRVVFAGFAATSTTVSLPPGWEQALAYNLALTWAPEFEAAPSAEVVEIARQSKGALKRMNLRPLPISSGLVGLMGGGVSNIITGQ